MPPTHRERSVRARDWLFALRSRGMCLSLDNMRRAMRILGDPQDGLRVIHVAGTNGKGSVSVMISSVLSASGLRVGLYTSPHLIDLKERISINSRHISEEDLVKLVERVRALLEGGTEPSIELTFFEFVTAMALLYFAEAGLDVVVLETGLGGRYDATNVCTASVAAITRIGLDHGAQLGSSVESVASEKAGIIKRGAAIVSSAVDPIAMRIVKGRALELGCPIVELGKDFIFENVRCELSGTRLDYRGTRTLKGIGTNLLGAHQAENCATSIAAVDAFAFQNELDIPDDAVRRGLENAEWHGRLELVSKSPMMIVDCGHNPTAILSIMDALSQLGLSVDTLIYASSKDKDYRAISSVLFPRARRIILTRYESERSEMPESLARLPECSGREVEICQSVPAAIEHARKITPKGENILVIGSIFLAGETLSWLRDGRRCVSELAGF